MARRKLPSNPFASEAALCAAFIERAQSCGWAVYPEVAGWDIVLATGVGDELRTIGIQAKLRRSWQLLAQASDPVPSRGPDFRAILIPSEGTDSFGRLARELRLEVYAMDRLVWRDITEPDPTIRWKGYQPLVLPSVPGIGRAGTPAPIQLTPWRERAIVLCHLLKTRGWISGHDFERLGVSRGNWLNEWIVPVDGAQQWHFVGSSRRRRYIQGCRTDALPDARYTAPVRLAVFAAWAVREPWLLEEIEVADQEFPAINIDVSAGIDSKESPIISPG